MIEYNGLESYELLPDDYILLEDLWEIFELIDKNKLRTMSNCRIRSNLKLILYNPIVKLYYARLLHENSDRIKLSNYFKDKNLYINKNDLIWKK